MKSENSFYEQRLKRQKLTIETQQAEIKDLKEQLRAQKRENAQLKNALELTQLRSELTHMTRNLAETQEFEELAA